MSAPTEPTHDEQVAFARRMLAAEWQYSEEPGALVLNYFEEPHCWDKEFQKWKEIGDVKFDAWLEWHCKHCDEMPGEGQGCGYCNDDEEEDEQRERDAIYRHDTRVTG